MLGVMNDTPPDTWTGPAVPDDAALSPPPLQRPPSLVRRRVAGAAVVTGLVAGGMVGGYVISQAASATASPSPSLSPSPNGGGGMAGCGNHGAGRQEDLQVVATAIGISLGDLQTALHNGQSIAAVAKAHNVDVNKVISALVASENAEVDSALKAGRITQAQATQMKAQTQQRVTDMVNGTPPSGGPRGFGGPHGDFGGGPGAGAPAPGA